MSAMVSPHGIALNDPGFVKNDINNRTSVAERYDAMICDAVTGKIYTVSYNTAVRLFEVNNI
jgi:hypothetical protein